METKNPVKSKTMWGAVIIALPSVLEGLGVAPAAQQVTMDMLDTMDANQAVANQSIIEMIGIALVIWGRITATTKLGLEKKRGAS